MAVIKKATKVAKPKKTKPKVAKMTKATAKPTVKTTTAKATTKPAKVVKPKVVKVSNSTAEMRISGKKMIGTIQKEFTTKFPYLRLSIYPYSEKSKSTKSPFSRNIKIGDVRKKDTAGEISINGRTLVKNLESNFEKIFGLYAQVAYTKKDGSRCYTAGSLDEQSLTFLNFFGENEGWQKCVPH
jgi:hypothetical protein